MADEQRLNKEKIKEDIEAIVQGKYPEAATVQVGENRHQLFIRIPKIITTRLKLKKGDQILFKVFNENGKPKAEILKENAP